MNNKYKILLVEDDESICVFISALLESNGYQVLTATSAASGCMMYASHIPDLLILDLGLPDADGRTVLEKIRKTAPTPIIVLSARTDEREKVELLDLGANDYITKPFGSSELLARIRAALRSQRNNGTGGTAAGNIFTVGEMEIRYDSRRVFLQQTEIKLTQTEYNILAFLSAHTDTVMTYSAIIKAVWHELPDENNIKRLQVNMVNIRKKFGVKPGETGYIVNELGIGYRFSAPF